MKQIAYLGMVFLLPTFMTVNHSLHTSHRNGMNNNNFFQKGIFGMNAKEVNPGSNGTILPFVALAAPLAIVTIWIFIVFQDQYLLRGKPFVQRLGWPVLLLHKWWYRKDDKDKRRRPIDRTMREDYEEGMPPNDSWA